MEDFCASNKMVTNSKTPNSKDSLVSKTPSRTASNSSLGIANSCASKVTFDECVFSDDSSVSKIASKKLSFSPDTTTTDDTVLDEFDLGEDFSDGELKEKFKNENW
jgi:hypothetical protein